MKGKNAPLPPLSVPPEGPARDGGAVSCTAGPGGRLWLLGVAQCSPNARVKRPGPAAFSVAAHLPREAEGAPETPARGGRAEGARQAFLTHEARPEFSDFVLVLYSLVRMP